MANMDITQRMQFDRIDLSRPSTGVQVRDRRPVIAFTILALAVLGALVYATIDAIDGWAHYVVLGAIAATTIGVMIALDPLRRG